MCSNQNGSRKGTTAPEAWRAARPPLEKSTRQRCAGIEQQKLGPEGVQAPLHLPGPIAESTPESHVGMEDAKVGSSPPVTMSTPRRSTGVPRALYSWPTVSRAGLAGTRPVGFWSRHSDNVADGSEGDPLCSVLWMWVTRWLTRFRMPADEAFSMSIWSRGVSRDADSTGCSWVPILKPSEQDTGQLLNSQRRALQVWLACLGWTFYFVLQCAPGKCGSAFVGA